MTDSRDIEAMVARAGLPRLLREPLLRRLENLPEVAELDAESCATALRLIAVSEFAGGVMTREREWFLAAIRRHELIEPPAFNDLAEHLVDVDVGVIKTALRRYRNRKLLHILWREAAGLADVWDTLEALSALANVLIVESMQLAEVLLAPRFGTPQNSRGQAISPVVLAMGKLGGGELNFSSDIDLIFLYTEEGQTDGPRVLSAHEYFARFSRQIVSLLDETTADGFVYRVDTRLRPFGDSGPPVISFVALENYLLQHGRSWERYAYVKAKIIAPTAPAEVIDELRANVIDPFVYRRYLDYGVFESLRDMKSLIEAEVRQRALADNIKLGPGGIREIEFIAQSLQLVRGGADRQLRQRSLMKALAGLGHARGLGEDVVTILLSAYEFLRRFENGIQAIRDQQTHEIPADAADRERLTVVMGYSNWDDLAADLARHRHNVADQFAAVAFRGDGGGQKERPGLIRWSTERPESEWAEHFAASGYDDAADLARVISKFAGSSVHRQIDATARKRLDLFMESFLSEVKSRPRPAVVCERVLSVLTGIVRRSAYVALLNENPSVLQRLVDLCEQSAYLAAEIARYPLLLDELLDPRLYILRISKADMQQDLDERLSRIDTSDSEGVIEALTQFQRATLFRIAVADINGRLPIMKVSDGLTWLAEIVLNAALDVAWRDLVRKHGEPVCCVDGVNRKAGFGVIAYGKLGGLELSYGSDLDLVFLHDSLGTAQVTDGDKPLDNSMFFGRLVRRLVHFLTTQTSSGMLYEVDTRLRPSGRSGLLVVSTEGFEKYQEENAWTWEHQALLRSRPVAGSPEVAEAFERIRADTLRTRVRRDRLLDDVLSMRRKMRQQLDKSDAAHFDLKQGKGGIGDIEFLVQYLVLKNAGSEPSLIHFSDNIRQLDALDAAGILASADAARLQEAYKAFRLQSHRLALDGRPSLVAPTEFTALRDFVSATWRRVMK